MQHDDGAQFCGACGLNLGAQQASGATAAEPIINQPTATSTYSGKAIAGFVLSLVGLFCAGLIMGILGIVFSRKGMRECDENPSLMGRGLAVAGLVISILDLVGAAITVMYFIFRVIVMILTL